MTYKILRIIPQKRKERVNLIFENNEVLGISIFLLDKFNLQENTVLTANQLIKIVKKDLFQRGKDKALKFLSFRPRSINEIKSRLKEYFFKILAAEQKEKKNFLKKLDLDFANQTIEKIIIWLEKQRLVDDLVFSCWWIDQRKRFKAASKKQIVWELRKKGIGRELIEKAFLNSHFSELENAKELIRRRLKKSISKLEINKLKKKLWQWLSAKGFSYQTIKQAIDEELNFE